MLRNQGDGFRGQLWKKHLPEFDRALSDETFVVSENLGCRVEGEGLAMRSTHSISMYLPPPFLVLRPFVVPAGLGLRFEVEGTSGEE